MAAGTKITQGNDLSLKAMRGGFYLTALQLLPLGRADHGGKGGSCGSSLFSFFLCGGQLPTRGIGKPKEESA